MVERGYIELHIADRSFPKRYGSAVLVNFRHHERVLPHATDVHETLASHAAMKSQNQKDGGLRGLERANLKHFHWISVETGLTGAGVPDMNYCAGGQEGWIENKQCKGWRPKMRAEQIGWLLRRRRAGGRAFIAVRRENAAANADELYLIDGQYAARLATEGLETTPHLLRLVGGPHRWPWGDFERALLKPVQASAKGSG